MLRPPPKSPRGFTLIELAIGIVILSVIIVMAMPSLSLWIRNMGIRGTAESLLSGLQLARTEALRRNTIVRFQLTTTLDGACALSTNGPHWIISRDAATGLCATAPSETDAPRLIRFHDGAQAGGNQTLIDAGDSQFAFNGLGRLVSPDTDTDILVAGLGGQDDCAPDGKEERCLRIEVSTGGSIRMCNPSLPNTNPQGCS
jgi:type IV fimbrial biogenesis protein FimT